MFADRSKILIKSGKGGDGHISFRREKFVPDGGPDGGDGGRGGDVIFEVDNGLNTLVSFRHHYKFVASNGGDGGNRRRHGPDGKDLVLKVPPGTVVTLAKTGEVIADMSGSNKRIVVLRGGKGGNGNMHYATSSMQAPVYAQPGQEGRELEVILELKLIADAGFIGYPNAGKSTLLSRISNANPKIAEYPFTTLEPKLGVVDLGDGEGFVAADIPGLIEGASHGAGLGYEFLRHIERCRLLIHVVDVSSACDQDPVSSIYKINRELALYNVSLEKKPQIIAANKIDLLSASLAEGGVVTGGSASNLIKTELDADNTSEENGLSSSLERDPIRRLREEFEPKGVNIYPVSASTGQGVRELLYAVYNLLKALPLSTKPFEQEYFPEDHFPLESRPFEVWRDQKDKGIFHVEGPKVEKMLGYTNLNSEKGFRFFQNFMKDSGILKELEALGIKDGDTVMLYNLQFDYYK